MPSSEGFGKLRGDARLCHNDTILRHTNRNVVYSKTMWRWMTFVLALGVEGVSALEVDAVLREIEAARTELQANPASWEGHLRLGFGYLAMDALEQAEETFQKATRLQPNQPSGFYWLGRTLFARGRYEAAAQAFSHVVTQLPQWGEAYAELGRSYLRMHRRSEAETALRSALALMAEGTTPPPEIVPPPSFGEDHSWLDKIALLGPVEVRYFLAWNAFEQGRLEEAARECERALAGARSAEILTLTGMVAFRRGRIQEAENAFLEASQRNPNDTSAFYQLGTLYSKTRRHREAEAAFARWKTLEAARKPLEEEQAALLRNPDKALSLVKIGSLHLNRGEIQEAIVAYQKALWFHPDEVDAYNGLGHAYALLKDFGAALNAQHKALERAPHRAEVHAGLGFIRSQQALETQQEGDFAAALASYREAVRLKPDFVEAWERIGDLHAQRSQYVEAQTAYETALSLRPNARTYQSLGDVFLLQEKFDDAKRAYEEALRRDASLVEPRYNLGFLEYRAGNLEGAATHYRAVLSLDPNVAEAHHLLGLVYGDAERFADAEREYREALRLRPDSAPTLERLAHLLAHDEKRLDEALELAQRAVALRPQSASYWNTLAWVRYRRGEHAEAEKAIRQALQLDPNNALYQEGLRVLKGLHETPR